MALNKIGDLVPEPNKALLGHNSGKQLDALLQDLERGGKTFEGGADKGWQVLAAPLTNETQEAFAAPAFTCVVGLPKERSGVLKIASGASGVANCTLFVRLKRSTLDAWCDANGQQPNERRVFQYKLNLKQAASFLAGTHACCLGERQVYHPQALAVLCHLTLGGWLTLPTVETCKPPTSCGTFTLVALPPAEAVVEQCLTLLGHKATFTDKNDDMPFSQCVDTEMWGETHGEALRQEWVRKFKDAGQVFRDYAHPKVFSEHMPALNRLAPDAARVVEKARTLFAQASRPPPKKEKAQAPAAAKLKEKPKPAAPAAAAPNKKKESPKPATAVVELAPSDPSDNEEEASPPAPAPVPAAKPAAKPTAAGASSSSSAGARQGKAKKTAKKRKAADEDEGSEDDESMTSEQSSSEEGEDDEDDDGVRNDASERETSDDDEADASSSSSSAKAPRKAEPKAKKPRVSEAPESPTEEEEGATSREQLRAVADATLAAKDEALLSNMHEVAAQCYEHVWAWRDGKRGPPMSEESAYQVGQDLGEIQQAKSPMGIVAAMSNLVKNLTNAHAEHFQGETCEVPTAEVKRLHAACTRATEFSEATLEEMDKAIEGLSKARDLGRRALEQMAPPPPRAPSA